ncbi:MAG: hypothetical protein SD837_00015 [Candidatus Electrothrix scaldis]|nr:MAG: hypothetical protein SD837_00015 [Candidatus Electrothrix sp. GW3-3]
MDGDTRQDQAATMHLQDTPLEEQRSETLRKKGLRPLLVVEEV